MLLHSLSLVLGHHQAWRDPGETLSRIQASGNRCRKVKDIEIWRVCKILIFEKKKGKILSEQKEIHICSKAKLIKPSEEKVQRSLNWREENGRCRLLTALFMNLASSSILKDGTFSSESINWSSLRGKRVGHAHKVDSLSDAKKRS